MLYNICILPLENKFSNFNKLEFKALQSIINDKISINMMYFNI